MESRSLTSRDEGFRHDDLFKDQLEFPGCKGRKVESEFSGGDVTSDGGLLLLLQADRRLGLASQVARQLDDPRRQASCEHTSFSCCDSGSMGWRRAM